MVDLCGRVVDTRILNTASGSFRVKMDVPSGLYLANIEVDGKAPKTFKVVK